ncbi:MAG: PAS domain-containing sensor histidine kinase [Crocinitomicaceae bacterium]|nr:PAS domain-containing sensor histidine kinase [Crocinitomicaceae bacterium]
MSKDVLNKAGHENPFEDFQQIDVHGDIYKQIFEFSIIPTIVHDLDMKIINVNDKALEQFGYTREEFLNLSIFDLHTEDELEHSESVRQKMKEEMKLSVETRFKRKDRSIFDAEVTPCKYMVGDQPVIHVFIKDITDAKLKERKLQQYYRDLNAQIKKVEKQSRLIKAKNKELEEFAYVSAHDLKAPLSNLTALADMINVDAITDETNALVIHKLRNNIKQLNKTVNALNSVINFKTTLKDKKEHIRFEDVFTEIKETITEKINTDGISLNVDFTQCPEIYYPPLHLKSILQNLLTNAIKFKKPDEQLEIEITTTKQNGVSCLTVKDNGQGFDARKQKNKLFNLFSRLHPGIEGDGVGMYIVKSIVDTHGGKIEVESEPDKGATFKIELNGIENE